VDGRRDPSPANNHRPTSLPHDCAETSSRSVHLLVVGEPAASTSGWSVGLLRIASLSSSPRMRSAAQSRLFATICLIRLIVSSESFGFLECAFDVCFQNTRKSSRWKPRSVVFLDKEERLFPGPNHPGENHQGQPVGLPVDRSCDVSTQGDQLVSSQGVFRKQFGFASGQIGERAEHKGGRRFDPTRKPV
jgi:hypothetical protein